MLLLTPILKSYFGESAQFVQHKNSQILNLSQTVKGWTMTLTDCVGDDQYLYIGMEVTAPAGTVLDESGGGSGGLGVKDMQEKGFSPGYNLKDIKVDLDGANTPSMAKYANQIPDENASDNHLSFVLYINCSEPLDGKTIKLTMGDIFHILPDADGTKVYDFDGSWFFPDIQLDLADQTVRSQPNLTVPVLDTTATLTELTVSPISLTVTFEGSGLIGQEQRYPRGFNIADPTIVFYDKQGKVMQMQRNRAPFGSRAQSGSDNDEGTLRIVEAYETFIDLDALGSIAVCGVAIPINNADG